MAQEDTKHPKSKQHREKYTRATDEVKVQSHSDY